MCCDLSQFPGLTNGKIRLLILGITSKQLNPRRDDNVDVNDPRSATLSFAPRCPTQLSHPSGSRNHVARSRMLCQIRCELLDPINANQLLRLDLELRQLQNGDFGCRFHYSGVYRNAA
jgi:hypothetical protein